MSGKYERELVNTLRTLEHNALRTPSSGSSTKTELPDFIASIQYTHGEIQQFLQANTNSEDVDTLIGALRELTQMSKIIGGELKSKRGKRIYINEKEVIDLYEYCKTFGCEPRIAARFKTKDTPVKTYLLHPEDLPQTPENNYKVTFKIAKEQPREIIQHETKHNDAAIELNETGTANLHTDIDGVPAGRNGN